ncbi:uncharacterized protein [Salvelinus alpinus]|uniref:uncharacterized protein isoform X1 n=2 Tax=Salvelinus alpinus TaxID=8036 RepID=UPI0039FB8F8B
MHFSPHLAAYTVYMIQPETKDVLKLLLKLVPSKSYVAPFKRVLLKEVFELSNYIDRSQLTAALGGYLVYCHRSCVTFIREIDAFVQEFLSVVQRLPSCISTLQTLSRQPMPSAFTELNDFCYSSEAKFQLLRRELGLDELLKHCDHVVEKLRYLENDSCYQAMAGTALFTHTAFNMLQNYSRITAAAETIELLWQQAFSKAHLQVQVYQLRDEAQQITEQIKSCQKEKLQPYRIEIAKDARKAETLTSEFEASIYTPAMALVHCAEDVIHTLADTLPPGDAQTREEWVQDLDRLKENFHAAVELPHQTLGAVADFYHYYTKMSASDFKAAGVLGLDDSLDSADTDSHSECRSSEAASETEASECSMSHNGRPMENGPTGLSPPQTNRGQFLKELKGLHVLDELIMEENLKIHKLRQAENESLDEKPPQLAGSRITCKERQVFLFELEREKREVERMEKNLAKEMTKGCQLTKRISRTRIVVKCSIMDRISKLNNLEVGALYDDLISDHRSQHLNVKHLPTLPKDTINLDPNESLVITATFSAIMPVSQDSVQSVNGQSPHADSSISGCGDAMVEVDAPSHSEFTEPRASQPVLTPPQSYSDPSEFIEEVGIQHQEGTDEEGLDFRLVYKLQFPQEATLTPEMFPEHGVFDPSWNYNPPVSKPRKASLPVNDKGQELNISTETMYLTLCSALIVIQPLTLDSHHKSCQSSVLIRNLKGEASNL